MIKTHWEESPLKKYFCTKCERSYRHQYDLEHHVNKKHQNVQPFKCQTCDKSFFGEKDLNYHNKNVHPVKRYSCSKCEKFYLEQHDLEHLLDLIDIVSVLKPLLHIFYFHVVYFGYGNNKLCEWGAICISQYLVSVLVSGLRLSRLELSAKAFSSSIIRLTSCW